LLGIADYAAFDALADDGASKRDARNDLLHFYCCANRAGDK
jgi:hypothetical protein